MISQATTCLEKTIPRRGSRRLAVTKTFLVGVLNDFEPEKDVRDHIEHISSVVTTASAVTAIIHVTKKHQYLLPSYRNVQSLHTCVGA